MSLYLALDTATLRPTLALGSPERPGTNAVITQRRDLSRDIDVRVAQLFVERGRVPSDLDGIVVADGPGSFTGLRIGIAFAKGLCRALDIPLLAAPSLLGAAWSLAVRPPVRSSGRLIVASYPALRGDVYRAVYRFAAGTMDVVEPPSLRGASEPAPPDAVLAGEEDASAAALLSLVGRPGGPQPVPDAAAFEPVYGRPAEAEARRLARNGVHR